MGNIIPRIDTTTEVKPDACSSSWIFSLGKLLNVRTFVIDQPIYHTILPQYSSPAVQTTATKNLAAVRTKRAINLSISSTNSSN